MSKFLIECPHCGTYNSASDSFFSRNVVECTCGKLINVKKEKLKSVECPHCKNYVVYDQSKGKKAVCPICKQKITTDESMRSAVEIHCPTCSCEITVDKHAKEYVCPLCNTKVDVQFQIEKEKIQKEGMISVIKYEGPNDVFVWKHPIENFNFGSQLIVQESQEAIFFKDGRALDCFGAGRYTLSTQNIPLLKELYKIPSGSQEIFHSKVYFINQTVQMGIKWGTDSKVRLFDPYSGLTLELGANGYFSLQVNNSRKLLLKLVGTTSSFGQSDAYDYSTTVITGKFKGLIINKVKSLLAKTIKEKNINILEIDEHIDDISEVLKENINVVLDEYGLHMPEFYVTKVLTPDEDPNFARLKRQYAEKYLIVREENIQKEIAEAKKQRLLVEAQTQAQSEIIKAQTEAQTTLLKAQAQADAYKAQAEAEAQEMHMKGYTYQQETQRQIGVNAVQNISNGVGGGGTGGIGNVTGVVGDMVGLGLGLGVMGEVVNTVKGAVSPMIAPAANAGSGISEMVNQNAWECPNCHSISTTPFCSQCGTKKVETKPQIGWNCSCGATNISSPFCPQCGSKKPEPTTWNCQCGATNISSPFCPQCGNKRGE